MLVGINPRKGICKKCTMNGLLKANFTYTTKQYEIPIKTAKDRMSFSILGEDPSRSNPEYHVKYVQFLPASMDLKMEV